MAEGDLGGGSELCSLAPGGAPLVSAGRTAGAKRLGRKGKAKARSLPVTRAFGEYIPIFILLVLACCSRWRPLGRMFFG